MKMIAGGAAAAVLPLPKLIRKTNSVKNRFGHSNLTLSPNDDYINVSDIGDWDLYGINSGEFTIFWDRSYSKIEKGTIKGIINICDFFNIGPMPKPKKINEIHV